MTTPWYKAYFTEDYWRFATFEYSAERTGREVLYLLEVFKGRSPGRRVADVGCGLGRHAIALAEAGFDVVGLDASEWAIEEARRRSSKAGVKVRFEVIDLLTAESWPFDEVDAIICLQVLGWGSDSDQLRLLRRLRHHLAADGLLILDHSNLLWIARNFSSQATDTIGEVEFEFNRDYEALTGKSVGSLTVSQPNGKKSLLPHDVRLYTTPEVIALAREAGYYIERIDADFNPGGPVTMDTRYVQVIARPALVPPSGLAVRSYMQEVSTTGLDLRWSPDEIEWVKPSPAEVWTMILSRDPNYAADIARRYSVDDPYGAERAAKILSNHFGCRIQHQLITFGAGVTSLLRQLIGLANRGLVVSARLTHPDLLAWAALTGSEVLLLNESVSANEWASITMKRRPNLLYIDRPSVVGELIELEELETIARAAQAVGAVVLIDEAYSSYFAGSNSAVEILHRLSNIVVLRSMSKAYSWGGIRVGFAIASEAVAARVRELIAPLEVSEISYQMALHLLALNDIFEPLRSRIREVKTEMIERLSAIGLDLIKGHVELPWVVIRDVDGAAWKELTTRGIIGKYLVIPRFSPQKPDGLFRLSTPLSEERVTHCWDCLNNSL